MVLVDMPSLSNRGSQERIKRIMMLANPTRSGSTSVSRGDSWSYDGPRQVRSLLTNTGAFSRTQGTITRLSRDIFKGVASSSALCGPGGGAAFTAGGVYCGHQGVMQKGVVHIEERTQAHVPQTKTKARVLHVFTQTWFAHSTPS
jgi:hypothetical protein